MTLYERGSNTTLGAPLCWDEEFEEAMGVGGLVGEGEGEGGRPSGADLSLGSLPDSPTEAPTETPTISPTTATNDLNGVKDLTASTRAAQIQARTTMAEMCWKQSIFKAWTQACVTRKLQTTHAEHRGRQAKLQGLCCERLFRIS